MINIFKYKFKIIEKLIKLKHNFEIFLNLIIICNSIVNFHGPRSLILSLNLKMVYTLGSN